MVLDFFRKNNMYPGYMGIGSTRLSRTLRKWRSTLERYERTFIEKGTSSSFRVAWNYRNEQELFSRKRSVHDRYLFQISFLLAQPLYESFSHYSRLLTKQTHMYIQIRVNLHLVSFMCVYMIVRSNSCE